MAENNLIAITGLWVNEDQNGNKYFSGTLGTQCNVLIMKNKFKKEDNHPDWIMYYGKKKKKEDNKVKDPFDNQQSKEPEEDDIPF